MDRAIHGVRPRRGRLPEPDADEAAGRGDPGEVLVAQVPGVVADAADAGVRGDDGRVAIARASSIVRADAWATSRITPRASIRRDHLAARRREPALLDAVRGAAEDGVEEVGRRDHPDAGVGDDVHVGGVVVERMGALDREDAGGHRRVRRPVREVGREVRARPEEPEGAARAVLEPARLRREVEDARQEPAPGRGRPALRQRERQHLVARVRRCARCSGAAGRLHRPSTAPGGRPALDQPRDVHVAAVAAPQRGRDRTAASRRGGRRRGGWRGGRAPGPARASAVRPHPVHAALARRDQARRAPGGPPPAHRSPRRPAAMATRVAVPMPERPGRASGRIRIGTL